MCKVRILAAAGVFLALSVLVISGMIASSNNRTYGYMRWNDNDDRRY